MTERGKVENWVNRMTELLQYTDAQIYNHRTKFEKKCCYGAKHFCDGTINGAIRNRAKENKPLCKYFKNGQCELMLHVIDVRGVINDDNK